MRIKTTNLLRLAFMFLFMAMTAMTQAATDDFDVLMQRIRKDFSRNPNIEATFKQYDAQKGAFTDIDYSRDDLTNWPPLKHLDRQQQEQALRRGRSLRKHSKSSAALAERQSQLPQLVV